MMFAKPFNNLQSGLTLIELMVTLAVAIVMMAIGIPLFDRLVARNQVTAQTNILVTALTTARVEALTRGVPVAVCAKSSASPTDTTCGTSSDWGNGWQVFVDDGGTAGSYNSASEQMVRIFEDLAGSAQVTASAAAIRFARDGSLDTSVHDGSESFKLAQNVSGLSATCVQLTMVGQLSTDKIAATDTCP